METVWYLILAGMIAVYVVLDGFDLGAGALHLIVARTQRERERITEAIGPIWNGNEVWLIAGGAVLFLAFPKAYASAFSGLYFGLIIVLWLLIGRGLALELRHQIDSPLWRSACDVVFSLASGGLAFVFGVALGNVVRGAHIESDLSFQLSLFELLNWYALLVGLYGLIVLACHGATFLALRAGGEVAQRAARWARGLWWAQAAGFVALIGPTYAVREEMLTGFGDHVWTAIFPLAAVAALVALAAYQRRALWGRAFLASCGFIATLLCTMAAGLYPNVFPAREGGPNSLTIDNAAAGSYALEVALYWWVVALALAIAYFTFVYRHFFFEHEPPD